MLKYNDIMKQTDDIVVDIKNICEKASQGLSSAEEKKIKKCSYPAIIKINHIAQECAESIEKCTTEEEQKKHFNHMSIRINTIYRETLKKIANISNQSPRELSSNSSGRIISYEQALKQETRADDQKSIKPAEEQKETATSFLLPSSQGIATETETLESKDEHIFLDSRSNIADEEISPDIQKEIRSLIREKTGNIDEESRAQIDREILSILERLHNNYLSQGYMVFDPNEKNRRYFVENFYSDAQNGNIK